MKRILALSMVAALAACGTARRSAPLIGPPELKTEEQRRGKALFLTFCHQCHPGGEAGLGPALNDKPAPGPVIKLQVRSGLGAMPAFSDEVISSADLDRIVEYMIALRRSE